MTLGTQGTLTGAPAKRLHFLSTSTGLEAAERDAASILVNGIVGEAVTFPLNLRESEEIENIAWNFKTTIAFVVPGRSGKEPQVNVAHQNYFNRINVSRQSYNLQISHLSTGDAGTYQANINRRAAGKELSTTTKTFELEVYRKWWRAAGWPAAFLCGSAVGEHLRFRPWGP